MDITAPLFRPRMGETEEAVHIVLIQPDGFRFPGIFDDVAETLRAGFQSLGYKPAIRTNTMSLGVPTIVLGAHMVPEAFAKAFPVGTIIYNLEQIRPGAWAANPVYFRMLSRHTVWDFNAANVTAIIEATGNPDVHHVPIGYTPSLRRLTAAPEQDIDVLFYGSGTSRRMEILRALAAAGINVKAIFGVFGEERDKLIARAKVVLNLHAHDGWGFEIVRVSYLLANRKAVVCEAHSAEDVDPDLRGAVRAVPYDQLVTACQDLVKDASARAELENNALSLFRQRDEAAILRRALTMPAPPPPTRVAVAPDHGAALRARYLDLLADALTNQIYADAPFDPWSGGVFDPNARRLGRDWPSQAMTMIGEHRLRNIRTLVEIILAENVPGDLIETGVWRGGACIFMRGLLSAYDIRDRTVWVADSFAGLPPPDPNHPRDAGDQHHTHAQLAVSLEAVQGNFRKFNLLDDQVRFLRGWFSETLPSAPVERLALLRLDGDMYGSTMDALNALYAKVSPGGFVIVDDYGAVEACRAAITDFRAAHGITAPIQDIDGLGVFWRVPR